MPPKNRVPEKDPALPREGKTRQGQLITYFIIFVVGFLAGIAFTVYKGGSSGPAPAPVAEGQPQAPHEETTQAISRLEAEVTANPDNYQSWIQLGHLYYDSDQPEKAIAAYTKSLELHEGDANLLTDLGVMYRSTKQPAKAIEYFDQAITKEPSHQPSRFNKGIVLLYDLKDAPGALASWEGLLKINPQAKAGNGQAISEMVDKLKADMAQNKKTP